MRARGCGRVRSAALVRRNREATTDMANNPKKIVDPTEAALSAIQEALKVRDGADLQDDRRHPPDRRAQYRPFPDRRGDLHRAGRQRSPDARADG